MGTFLIAFGEFLLAHYDLINDIQEALAGGASKELIRKSIRDSMVAASDAVVEAELGPRPKA